MDMQKKTAHIMDPLPDDVCYKGYAQIMPYIATFHTIAKKVQSRYETDKF